VISYRSNFTGLPAPAPRAQQPQPAAPGKRTAWHEGRPWTDEDLAELEALLAAGMSQADAARAMGRRPSSATWAVEKIKRRRAREQA